MTKATISLGRILATALGLWFRRFLPIHAVAVLCLLPIACFSKGGYEVQEDIIPGLHGLYAAAWVSAFQMLADRSMGHLANVAAAYATQLLVIVLLVRDAHRQLTGRGPRTRPSALLGLVFQGIAGLAAFTLLDLAVRDMFDHASPTAILIAILVNSVVQSLLASWFALALPAAAVDGFGPLAAFRRSARLGRGHRFRVVLPIVMVVVLQIALAVLLSSLLVDASPWWFALPALLLTLKGSILAVLYRDLCLAKEGPHAEDLGRVFA